MNPSDTLAELLLEIDRTHTPAYCQSDAYLADRDFPDFATAANGEVRNFYKPARKLLAILTIAIYEQHPAFNKRMDEKRFAAHVRQAVADLHASEALVGVAEPLKVLVDELIVRADIASSVFTHSFPAWTCGVEDAGEWTFGPVTFLTWPQWLSHVDFSDQAKSSYLDEPEANSRWKEILLAAIDDRNVPVSGFAGLFIGAMTDCPAVLRVEVGGMEKNQSRKLAEMVCKGALDAVSLLIGQRQFFSQQALQVERLPPAGINSIIESDGHLWLPGTSLTDRVAPRRGSHARQWLRQFPSELQAMAHAINGLLDRSHSHPQLASRWATALDWYAEGQRERSEAIALAKLGTSLDVLASGGKFAGILSLLVNLLGVPENAAYTRGTKQTTLKAVVKDIYDSGRSQILHGTRHDRMEAFERDRDAAAYLARLALIEAALRLQGYKGADEPKAFRTMQTRAS
ncbi:hypothetical protein [Lysobacter capsici]|uniref:hypothetical protein n=1 Tax=Lysobacter capsici TaxID=435897 RepID=UPI00287B7416|nr:hypothetical protein [Lysobacter capsici]WND81119.1 hypothetical protein RJ610_01705 [Lysobacter capsici]WND86315.1 hypothetical protein RJ609_01705 [Lysobacter capsici]